MLIAQKRAPVDHPGKDAMNNPTRHWLDVPYSEKDTAKAAGARWDPTARRWFAPRPGMPQLARWAAAPPVPDLLPGEDRSFGSGLFVDLVPSSCWFTNVRSGVAPGDWKRLRRMITSRAGERCEICHRAEDRDQRRFLEAHERWAFDEATSTQHLRRLICVCRDCHRVTHFGLAEIHGLAETAFGHLCAVTGMSADDANSHIEQAFALWYARSERIWALDLSILTDAGVTLAEPPPARERAHIAAATLAAEQDTESEPTPRRSPEITQPTLRLGLRRWLRRSSAR